MSRSRRLFRVKFQEKGDSKPLTVVCEAVSPSEIFGLVTLDKLIIDSGPKLVVLPEEDEVAKRFRHTEKLHLPFHVLVSVEEFFEEEEGEVRSLHVIKKGDGHEEKGETPS